MVKRYDEEPLGRPETDDDRAEAAAAAAVFREVQAMGAEAGGGIDEARTIGVLRAAVLLAGSGAAKPTGWKPEEEM